jgi:hypothetical protein
VTAVICVLGLLVGCSKVKVSPSLSSSLSYNAYKNMEVIDVRDASVGVIFDKDLMNAESKQTLKMGEFSFQIGESFAVKFIKALSHQFRRVVLLKNSQDMHNDNILDAIMRVKLQDIDSSMQVNQGFMKVSTEAYARINVRAELRDVGEEKIIWVGISQVNHTGKWEEMERMPYQEAGRGFADSFDKAIDKAIGDLLNQMQKSQNLKKYFDKWEINH